jgi:predicted transcriptional regulator
MHYNHHATAQAVSGSLPSPVLEPLSAGDSALLALTDFQRVTPLVIDESRSIGEALQSMIVNGVRALLAAHEGRITGFITSYDIQGERPIQFMNGSTYRKHEELQVNHVMTPWSQMSTVTVQQLQSMSVATLLTSMVEDRLTHILVLESASQSLLRGIVSRTRVERRLSLERAAASSDRAA